MRTQLTIRQPKTPILLRHGRQNKEIGLKEVQRQVDMIRPAVPNVQLSVNDHGDGSLGLKQDDLRVIYAFLGRQFSPRMPSGTVEIDAEAWKKDKSLVVKPQQLQPEHAEEDDVGIAS